jgi:hypothetical protein
MELQFSEQLQLSCDKWSCQEEISREAGENGGRARSAAGVPTGRRPDPNGGLPSPPHYGYYTTTWHPSQETLLDVGRLNCAQLNWVQSNKLEISNLGAFKFSVENNLIVCNQKARSKF